MIGFVNNIAKTLKMMYGVAEDMSLDYKLSMSTSIL